MLKNVLICLAPILVSWNKEAAFVERYVRGGLDVDVTLCM